MSSERGSTMKGKDVRYYRSEQRGLEIVRLRGSRIFYPEHSHVSACMVSFVLAGCLRLETRRGISFQEPRSFFSIPSFEPHSLSCSGSCETVTLCIGNDLLRSFFDGTESIPEFLGSLSHVLPLPPDAFSAGFATMLGLLFPAAKASAARESPVVEALERQLLLSPEESFDLESFAAERNISRFHLLREFKKTVGLPPHRFQIQNRIRKARKMILHGSLPLTEVALAAGFYDQSHFIRCFRKFAGMTPSEFRESCVLERTSAERGEELGEK
ncbi:MAG: AraC family transcriptional regulator [Synergistales bacterium]|nr:AraC family transcriptional regulator [Synergistales bacterium]